MTTRTADATSAIRELAWLGLMLVALAAALAFEHWVVHLQMLLPALAQDAVPPWLYGALFVPELVACFLSGWRLRSKTWIVTYAIAAALIRQLFHAMLGALGEPGHRSPLDGPAEFAIATPIVVFLYALVFSLAAQSSKEIDPAKGL